MKQSISLEISEIRLVIDVLNVRVCDFRREQLEYIRASEVEPAADCGKCASEALTLADKFTSAFTVLQNRLP